MSCSTQTSLCLAEQEHRASLPCGLLRILMSRDVSSLLSLEFSCALINRDPSWFNETWLGRIKEESGANWRLKVICETAGYDRMTYEKPESPGFFFSFRFFFSDDNENNSLFVLSGQQLEEDSEEHAGILSRRKMIMLMFCLVSRDTPTRQLTIGEGLSV